MNYFASWSELWATNDLKEFVLNNAILINGDKINDINYIVDNNSFIDNTYIVIKRGKKNYCIGKKEF